MSNLNYTLHLGDDQLAQRVARLSKGGELATIVVSVLCSDHTRYAEFDESYPKDGLTNDDSVQLGGTRSFTTARVSDGEWAIQGALRALLVAAVEAGLSLLDHVVLVSVYGGYATFQLFRRCASHEIRGQEWLLGEAWYRELLAKPRVAAPSGAGTCDAIRGTTTWAVN